jgi:hypothetical protein
MGKTKIRKKSKQKISKKKIKGGAKITEFVKIFLSILLFGIFFYMQCYVLNQSYHLQMSFEYMKDFHNWFLFVKNFSTFLDKLYPNNPFTSILYSSIKNIVNKIPAKDAIQNMIPSVIARPNILKSIHYYTEQNIEKSQNRDAIISLSKGAEQLSEYLRIFALDLDSIEKMNSLYRNDNFSINDYTTLLHVAIHYDSKFNEIIAYINNLLIAVYNKDPRGIGDWFFGLKPVSIFKDGIQNVNLSEDIKQTIQNMITHGYETIKNSESTAMNNMLL